MENLEEFRAAAREPLLARIAELENDRKIALEIADTYRKMVDDLKASNLQGQDDCAYCKHKAPPVAGGMWGCWRCGTFKIGRSNLPMQSAQITKEATRTEYDYPELPKGAEACEFNSYCTVYDADDMREYVDADRRLRGTPPAKQGGVA